MIIVKSTAEIQSLYKSFGVKNYSRLQRKHIVDKNGRSRIVYVKPDEIKIKKLRNGTSVGNQTFTDDEMKILNEFIQEESKVNNYETQSMNNLMKYISGKKGSSELLNNIPISDGRRTELRRKINLMKEKYGYSLINILVPAKEKQELEYADEMYYKCRIKNMKDIAKDFKSTKEIESFMRNTDWFTDTQKNVLSLKGVDLELAKDIVNSYNFIFELFPGMKQRIGACYSINLNKPDAENKTWADYDPNTTSIELDKESYSNKQKLQTEYYNSTMPNSAPIGTLHPVNTDYRQIFIHELIHAIDYGVLKVFDKNNEQILPSKYICNILNNKLKLDSIILSNELSYYGATKGEKETLAEAISEFICSSKPRPISIYFAEEFFRILYTRRKYYGW